MRWHEIVSGIRVGPISEEEAEVLAMAGKGSLAKDDLDERTEEIARQMVSRGILKHSVESGKVVYKANSATDIWRDRS